jgi:hypothetical protein
MGIPSNRVNYARGYQNYADWTNPAFALVSITACGLGNLKLNSTLYLNMGDAHAQTRNIKFLILTLRSVSTALTPGH